VGVIFLREDNRENPVFGIMIKRLWSSKLESRRERIRGKLRAPQGNQVRAPELQGL
jgi:hypothetical protein